MKKFFSNLTFATALTVAFASCNKTDINPADSTLAEENTVTAQKGIGVQMMPNEVLIKFQNGLSAETKAKILERIQGSVREQILTAMMRTDGEKEGISLVHTPLEVNAAIESLRGVKEIMYVEPNYIYTHSAVSNDTYFTNGSLWGMYGSTTSPANQYGSRAANAWAAGHTGSSTVYVGIIDEGYMYTHADLAANAGTNPGEIAGNGIDDDGNGFKDDVYGWDFAGNNNTVFDGVADDHGTHVAGTIGGKGGNATGVAGVCWNVKMLSAKFLGSTGGTTANAIKANDYFTDLKVRHNIKLVATNNSWGGGGFSQGVQDAIERANTRGILFIAAAGNGGSDGIGDNNNTVPNYPSNYPNANIIAVASITSTGALSSFSNFGSTQVDLGAPGSGIWSTVPKASGSSVVSGYASYNGTSMATPHVSGAAALYAASNPSATAATIKAAILNSVIATPSLSGKTVTGGRLNVSGF